VQVIYQSSGWTTIKPIHGGEKRDISTACEVLPCDGREYEKPQPHRATWPPKLETAKTMGDLMLLIVCLRYERGLSARNRQIIFRAGRRYGLLSETEEDSPYRGSPRGPRPTSKYFALLNDDVEKLARVTHS
jgi:hypothetical protein